MYRWQLSLISGIFFLVAPLNAGSDAFEDDRTIILLSTTSTRNSGLMEAILPLFYQRTGIKVQLVAVGTGQALRNARRGDGDVVLVHAPELESEFVSEGFGVARVAVMENEFLIVGPASDPANISIAASASDAVRLIAMDRITFLSRGDQSGTHHKERSLWKQAELAPWTSRDEPAWYREGGSGMGATLNMAAGMNAYTLTDQASWMAFRNRRNLVPLFSGDPGLLNPYSVIRVNPSVHPHVDSHSAEMFVCWLTSREGQEAIRNFRIDGNEDGNEVFRPIATRSCPVTQIRP